MKSANRCISVLLMAPAFPTSPSKATMNFRKAPFSSRGSPPASFPAVRSPRQCIGPAFASPRRLCVVIGPLSARKFRFSPTVRRKGFGLFSVPVGGNASGLPRSQARPSKSPKTWQEAHEASPLSEVPSAS